MLIYLIFAKKKFITVEIVHIVSILLLNCPIWYLRVCVKITSVIEVALTSPEWSQKSKKPTHLYFIEF